MPTLAPRKPTTRARRKTKCSVCRAKGPETFQLLRRRFIFDVDAARKIVADGRPAWTMQKADVRFEVETSHIHEQHVPHVKVGFPGIVARVRVRLPEGDTVEGDVLIDGHHRAAKCLRLNRPFSAYRLTVEESDAILLKRPDRKSRRAARYPSPLLPPSVSGPMLPKRNTMPRATSEDGNTRAARRQGVR
jgi:hypothetical protein